MYLINKTHHLEVFMAESWTCLIQYSLQQENTKK